MKLNPLGNRVLIKPTETENKTKGGIYIPDSAKEKKHQGEVVGVGLGKYDESGKRIPLDIKVGDIVLYKEYGGTDFEMSGQKYMLMDADDVLGVFN